MERCAWCGDDPVYVAYHDHEWGVPCHDDRHLFKFLILEGAQAGLSWITILRRQASYTIAYLGFDPEVVAAFTEEDSARLLEDPGIIRNRAKVAASILNAQAFLAIQSEFGSFDAYVWRFVDGAPIQNNWEEMREIPAKTPVSDALSKDLQKRGMKFVGSTIMYAWMQSMGLVNDHLVTCARHLEVQSLGP